MQGRLARLVIGACFAALFAPTASHAGFQWTTGSWESGALLGSNPPEGISSEERMSSSQFPSYFAARVRGEWTVDAASLSRTHPVGGALAQSEFSRGFSIDTPMTFDIFAHTFASIFSNVGAGAFNQVEYAVGISTTNHLANGVVAASTFAHTDAALTALGLSDYGYGEVHGFLDDGVTGALLNLKSSSDDTVRIALQPGTYYLVGYVSADSAFGDPARLGVTGACSRGPNLACLDTVASLSVWMNTVPEPSSLALAGAALMMLVAAGRRARDADRR